MIYFLGYKNFSFFKSCLIKQTTQGHVYGFGF